VIFAATLTEIVIQFCLSINAVFYILIKNHELRILWIVLLVFEIRIEEEFRHYVGRFIQYFLKSKEKYNNNLKKNEFLIKKHL